MLIDEKCLDSLLEGATESERRRMNFDLRTSPEDGSQRMLNAMLPGTVVPIHRHLDTTETVFVIRGRMTEVFYDDNGVECARYDLCPHEGRFGLQIPKGQWHTVVVEEPCVIFEAKDGEYNPQEEGDCLIMSN